MDLPEALDRSPAEEEKLCAAQQARTVPGRGRDRPDPGPADLPQVAQAQSGTAAPGPSGPSVLGSTTKGPAAPGATPRVEDQAVHGPQHEDGSQPKKGSDPRRRNAAHWAGSGRVSPSGGASRSRVQRRAARRDGVVPSSAPNPKAEAAVERLKEKLDQKAAHRTEEEQAEIDQARRAVQEPDPDEIDPAVTADLEAAGESRSKDVGRDPETGQFLTGHKGMGGRPPGSQNKFPTHYIRVMRELIAGRIRELIGDETDPIAISKIIAQLYFDGLQGKVEIRHGDKTMTVSPAVFLKLFQDWASSDLDRRLKRAALKKKGKGGSGGIRVVLPSPVVDPLRRPGQGTATAKTVGARSIKATPRNDWDLDKGAGRPAPRSARRAKTRSQIRSLRADRRRLAAVASPMLGRVLDAIERRHVGRRLFGHGIDWATCPARPSCIEL